MAMVNFFWLRRDLRLHDNAGLYHALRDEKPVQVVFIFDSEILTALPPDDNRVAFIHSTLLGIKQHLCSLGADLRVEHGDPVAVWAKLLTENTGGNIYTNRDYEPYARTRDAKITQLVRTHGGEFFAIKDHVIFHENEVVKSDNTPYTVFTPYKKAWLNVYNQQPHFYLKPYPTNHYFHNLAHAATPFSFPTLPEMGFQSKAFAFPVTEVADELLRAYGEQRDYPAKPGTSRLGLHLRFGTISIRQLAKRAIELEANTYLSELIWREFYSQILWHFPHTVNTAFKPLYDDIQWRNDENEFELWCAGQTGYPLVDAGMRELNISGYMHNRTRMVVASFLTKHLLIDWRWGERYFAEKLLDFDLASNVGGWQWAAGCGTDAAPYFRVFNPALQAAKFDPGNIYIRKWVPEFDSLHYPQPMVDHFVARDRCLAVFKAALGAEMKEVN